MFDIVVVRMSLSGERDEEDGFKVEASSDSVVSMQERK